MYVIENEVFVSLRAGLQEAKLMTSHFFWYAFQEDAVW